MRMREFILLLILFLLILGGIGSYYFYIRPLQDYIYDLEKEQESFAQLLGRKLDTLLPQSTMEKPLPSVLEKAMEMIKDEFSVQELKNKIHITIPSDDIFFSGGYTLSETGEKKLQKILEFLKSIPYHEIEVGVHTDDVPIQTKKELFPTNWELASRRATTIVRYFITQGNIKPENIYAVSYGDTRPLVPEKTEEARKKNRRVALQIMF